MKKIFIAVLLLMATQSQANAQSSHLMAYWDQSSPKVHISWVRRGCVYRVNGTVGSLVQCSWGGDVVLPDDYPDNPNLIPQNGDTYYFFDDNFGHINGEVQLPFKTYYFLAFVRQW